MKYGENKHSDEYKGENTGEQKYPIPYLMEHYGDKKYEK